MDKDKEGVYRDGAVGMSGGFKCPQCGSTEFEMRDYSMMWHEGNICCANCGKFIHAFDAG